MSLHENIAWEHTAVPLYSSEFPPQSFIKLTEGAATYIISILSAPPPNNKTGIRELSGQVIWASEAAAVKISDIITFSLDATKAGTLQRTVSYAPPPGQGRASTAAVMEQETFFIVRQVHNLVKTRLPVLQAKNRRVRYVPHSEIVQFLLDAGHWTSSTPIDFMRDLRTQTAYTTLTKRLQRLLKNYPEMFQVSMQGVRVRTDKDWAVHYMSLDGKGESKGKVLVHAGTVREAFRMGAEAVLTLLSAFTNIEVVER